MILPGRGNGRIRILAVVFILLTAAASLYGKGAREDSALSQADQLIADKEYDKAIQLLTDYMNANPNNFNAAQTRLQQIVRIRDHYNQVANELLDTLEKDPENNDKILELSNLLLTIESPSNPKVRQFLDKVRVLAEFNVNRLRLERLMAAAKVQLQNNDFAGALATYASGLDIYQKAYFSSGYGQEAEDTATAGLQHISANIQSFNNMTGPFSQAAQVITGLDKPTLPRPGEITSAYTALSPLMDELLGLRKDFYDIRKSYDDQLAVLQQEKGISGDMNFLSFAGRLITGPADQDEGMTGTLDRFWQLRLGAVKTALTDLVDRSYSEAHVSMINNDFSGGLSTFDMTAQYISSALKLVKTWDTFVELGNVTTYTVYGETVSEGELGEFLKYHSMEQAIGYYNQIGDIGNRGLTLGKEESPTLNAWQQGTMDTQTAISQEQNLRLSYQAVHNEIDNVVNQLAPDEETLRGSVANFSDVPGGVGLPYTYLTDARNIAVNLGNNFQARENNAAIRQYTIANGDLEKRTDTREAEFSKGNSLIQGVSQEGEGIGTYIAHYPSEGLAVLTQMSQNLATDISAARALIAQYAAEPQKITDLSQIKTLSTSAQDLLARLLALQNRNTGIMAATRTQVDRANAQKLEGDRLYQAAQAALNRGDFDTARNNLTKATDQYDASLAIQESTSLRSYRDNQVVKMGDEIVRRENEIVVRDVRNLVTSARTSYYAGNMDQAEELLVRAENRWRVTNITEHPDVEYWLNLVRGALSLQSGRTIPPTAPLYAEMSQLLSDANRGYNEGLQLLTSGQRSDGLAKFSESLAKTREVRLIFPMNHDARMLELRIEQQTDTNAFSAAFRQRISEAVAGTKQKNAESYAELQDLAEINPKYPGMQAILVQAEIDMGLRPPPPDPKDLARSAELTKNAQANINTRDVVRYQVAMTQLEEAVRLDHNNTQAQNLMDQLQILISGTGRFVMDSYTQERYNAAQQAYLQGNYLSANAIVLQLLQKPDNQRSTQLQDLKRRIDAVL